MIFSVRDLSFKYLLDRQEVVALEKINCEILSGDFRLLSGPSGSGKTTLLNLLGLIEPLQQGSIKLGDLNYGELSESEKNRLRRHKLGFVFQSFHLMPVLSAEENVEYFLHQHNLNSGERRTRVESSLKAVGLWDHRKKRPGEMSGGQRQRVAIARALAKNPQVILADEPTASLDQKTGREIMELFKELNLNQGVTLVISSHDPMVKEFVKNTLYLRDGRIVE